MLGTNEAGGIKAKNEFIHTTNWDIIVFDEYHFGAWRENAKNLFEKYDEEDDDFDLEKYQKEEAGNAINETFLPITSLHYLYLSGTPFRALNSGEFLEDQVFNWTYSDEQSAKENWDKSLGENPYAALPKMVMLTYKVPDSITANVAINEGYDEFDINEFFKAQPLEKGKIETSRFVYEEDVQKWVKMIQGGYMPVDGLKLGAERPPMPFSDTTLLNVLSHTFGIYQTLQVAMQCTIYCVKSKTTFLTTTKLSCAREQKSASAWTLSNLFCRQWAIRLKRKLSLCRAENSIPALP